MRNKKRLAVFASGNGTNAERIFKYFNYHDYIEVTLLLCNNPKAPVLQRAIKYNIPTFVFDRNALYGHNSVLETLQTTSIDFVVLSGFLWLLPTHLISHYPQRIINIHPALLPKYGGKGMYGRHVHEAVALAKEKETGITIHYVSDEYDEGKIIFQAKCAINAGDTAESIADKVHQLEYQYYAPVIELLCCAI